MGRKAQNSNGELDPTATVCLGSDLSDKRVAQIERRLLEDSSNLELRLLLLGFYERGSHHDGDVRSEEFLRHLIWMIQNHPDNQVLSHMQNYCYDNHSFRRAKWHWLRAVKLNSSNPTILNNAAHCFRSPAPKLAEKMWRKAQEIEPLNEEWPRELSFLFRLAIYKRKSRVFAERCIEEGKKALELHKKFPKNSYLETYMEMTVRQLAEVSLEFGLLSDAKHFGLYLTKRGLRDGKLTRKHKFEHHMGNSILGTAELTAGNIEGAREHLLKMPVLGDPYWRHDLLLARAMLEAGEKQSVVEYLNDCIKNIANELQRTVGQNISTNQVPAWVSLLHDAYGPSMNFTKFVRKTLNDKIAQITKWRNAIQRGRRVSLEKFI
jgi:hypothetical protein